MLAEVIVLTLFCMMVFALFAIQVYAGVLRHKCVVDLPPGVSVSGQEWSDHVKDPSKQKNSFIMNKKQQILLSR